MTFANAGREQNVERHDLRKPIPQHKAVAEVADAPPRVQKSKGRTRIIVVDNLPERLEMARRLGADFMVDYTNEDPIVVIMQLTQGRGVDIAIEALGTQQTFDSCLRVLTGAECRAVRVATSPNGRARRPRRLPSSPNICG